jgi:hypothetical protein
LTDFVNIKIKPAQSFRGAYRDRVCMYIFIGVSAHTYMTIYICTVFKKKEILLLYVINFGPSLSVIITPFHVQFRPVHSHGPLITLSASR